MTDTKKQKNATVQQVERAVASIRAKVADTPVGGGHIDVEDELAAIEAAAAKLAE